MAPNTAYAGGTFENDDLLTWVELDIRSGRGEAIPTCTSASVLYTFKHGDVDVLLRSVYIRERSVRFVRKELRGLRSR
jgi:hypothetical protein